MTDVPFERYLHAKRTVDDRAIDRGVLERVRRHLDRMDRSPIRVLEVGVGLGDSIPRFVTRGLFPDDTPIRYTGVDRRGAIVATARRRVREWAATEWPDGSVSLDESDGCLHLEGHMTRIDVELRTADAFEYIESADGHWDLLVAQSFLDLVDPATAVPRLFEGVRSGGLAYFPLTFDGGTVFEPTSNQSLDRAIVDAYHRTMDEQTDDRRPPGDRYAGRHLLERAPRWGATVLAAAGSDWVVHPVDGGYPAEEGRFLEYLLDTIEGAVSTARSPRVDDHDLDRWIAIRRRQLETGTLVYVAHQLDVLCRID